MKMSGIILPKRVQEFRNFVREKPKLFEQLKKDGYDWQSLYNEWDQYGEAAILFQQDIESKAEGDEQKDSSQKIKWQDILHKLSEMDVDRIEKHVKQLSSTMEQIQRISDQVNQSKRQNKGSHMGPFF
ncbi:hypothetical protein FPQ13_01955 [Allobacillus salarius]|uniref:Cytosolic protein n=2 Tax=Allobacillus TaxID=1400133 RepID=A0A556PRM5_9BACI|nr:hypothetical protein FPQ13_01955 [Allobacillus salarius]